MAATVQVTESNGPLASVVVTTDPANLNMGSADASELVPATYPITAEADGHSYEKWVRLLVSDMGGSSIVDNLKIWLSNLGGGWKTGEGISTNLKTSGYSAASYPTAGPVDSDSPDAVEVMPESEPSGANLGIGGALGGQIVAAPGYSDWAVLQLDVSASTPAGSLNPKTITFQWDEQ
jgi:hypothetical protein